MDEGEPPRPFELLLWGDRVPRATATLARAALPPGVRLRSGSEGAVLLIPLTTADESIAVLIDRLDRARREGELWIGVHFERPLDGPALLEEWRSAKRIAHLPVELTRGPPSEAPSNDVWWRLGTAFHDGPTWS